MQRLKELKSSLYEHDLSNKQIQAALNHAFEPLMIKFKVVAAPMKQSQYVEAGLNGASYDADGWITVALTDDVGDVLNGNASVAYEDFANLCNASIAHELTHRDQVLKHAGNMDGAKDPDRLRNYLSDHRELEAFAVQAVLELLSFWSPSDIISKMSRTSQLEHLAKWSDVLELYLSVFHNSLVIQRLLKKMHSILSELQDE